MAEHDRKQGIEGNVGGKAITHTAQQKIQDVLKSTLHAELASTKPTVGAISGRHGSITHGSVIFEE
jgi:hypothetical protein